MDFLNILEKRKMKLVVMIPAYNEAAIVGHVIKEIPKKIEGINKIKILVIDDGSSDGTAFVAKEAGADYILQNKKNQGLAYTFKRGLDFATHLNADIIVNIDGDGQYNPKEIPKLIKPILYNKADVVNGNRRVNKLRHMHYKKRYGNIIGTKVVAFLSGIKGLKDASSGFRAYSKEAALRFFILSKHTYTHETLIQATNLHLRIAEMPIEFKPRNYGKSKLITGITPHIKKSIATIVRTTLMYNSLKVLSYLGGILAIIGLFFFGRYLFYLNIGQSSGHIQSLIAGTVLVILGFLIIILGFISDIISINRKYQEEILYRLKKQEF